MRRTRFLHPLAALLLAGCSINKIAVNKLGNALAESGTTFSADDDPEFVGLASPFSLKLIESLLSSAPEHRGLLLAAAKGFTSYSWAFIQQDAERLEDSSVTRAAVERTRARRMYLRARDYGVRGLETRLRGFGQALHRDPRAAVRAATARDVPLLYWTAAAWGSAISLSKDDPHLVGDQPIVEAMIDRALQLDAQFDNGAIHGFLITYEMSRQGGTGDPALRSRAHFDRAVALSGGQLASPYLSLAEAVTMAKQDRREFETLLRQALAIDADARPEFRLVNLMMQRRARWLLARADELFLDPSPGTQP
jgi:predicted anti-sigma-YlaC factor YlaD